MLNLRDSLTQLTQSCPRSASPETEQRLLAAFRSRSRVKKFHRVYWAAVAAALMLGFYISWRTLSPKPIIPASGSAVYAAEAGFIALPYAQSGVPLEQAVVVRVNVLPSQAVALGLPPLKTAARESISADLLVGQDGVPRAVRFVP